MPIAGRQSANDCGVMVKKKQILAVCAELFTIGHFPKFWSEVS